jgi:hypothetical protein
MDRNEATALINVDTHELDISAIVSDHFDGQHVLQVRRKGSRHSETIMREDRKYEAFSYAILFPHGEDGWSRGCSFTFRDYLVSRMLLPEDGISYPSRDGNPLHIFQSNRFQIFHRLGQIYLCDQVSRMIDGHISFQKHHSTRMLQGMNSARTTEQEEEEEEEQEQEDDERKQGGASRTARAVDDNEGDESDDAHEDIEDNEVDDDDDDDAAGAIAIEPQYAKGSKKTFLSDKCHGSRRHLRKCAMNALHVVQRYGRSDLFITFTTNTNWPELLEALPPDKTAFDCPFITCVVFKRR